MTIENPKTFEDVLKNRRIWIDFLKAPEQTKAFRRLEDVNGDGRCCLGHACHILGERRMVSKDNAGVMFIAYGIPYNRTLATERVMRMLGLRNLSGRWPHTMHVHREDGELLVNEVHCDDSAMPYNSLANLNDCKKLDATPQEIGAYLEYVIEGGANSPFIGRELWERNNVCK